MCMAVRIQAVGMTDYSIDIERFSDMRSQCSFAERLLARNGVASLTDLH